MRYVRSEILFPLSIALVACSPVAMKMRSGGNTATVTSSTASKWSTDALGINSAISRRPFADTSAWNTDISASALSPNSASLLAKCGASSLHAAFGPPNGNASNGLSYVVVDSSQAPAAISFYQSALSDAGPYPVPTNVPIEASADPNSARRAIVLDRDAGKRY